MEGEKGGRHRRPERFRLLYVCTGNICRSPYAEIVTRHLLTGAMGSQDAAVFDVASAGSQAVAGAPMHPYMRRELSQAGPAGHLHAGRFQARQLTADLIGRADLILGLDRAHRAAVVEQEPAALPITFTLREFARLAAAVVEQRLPHDPADRAGTLVALARTSRARVRTADDEVPDPVGGRPAAHHRAAQLIVAAVHTIVGSFTADVRQR